MARRATAPAHSAAVASQRRARSIGSLLLSLFEHEAQTQTGYHFTLL
jgi:hypothetical protein